MATEQSPYPYVDVAAFFHDDVARIEAASLDSITALLAAASEVEGLDRAIVNALQHGVDLTAHTMENVPTQALILFGVFANDDEFDAAFPQIGVNGTPLASTVILGAVQNELQARFHALTDPQGAF